MNTWRILITPLYWGLGHATRCMPIIDELLAHHIEVFIGSDGEALNLLQETYPNCTCIPLPAYNIHYKSENMIFNLAKQSFHILTTMGKERLKIANIIEKHKINLLITDNRFGAYSTKIPTVFITHQLHIRVPNTILSKFVATFNNSIIKKYTQCWVPDLPDNYFNLSGDLSHPNSLFNNIKYIGALSRLKSFDHEKLEYITSSLIFKNLFFGKGTMVLVLLSGPEPQRTYLEEKLLTQAKQIKDKNFLFVRGVVIGEKNQWTIVEENIYIANYLQGEMLSAIIQKADFLVSRSGYSTIMDYYQLQKKNILFIPTPGQTEQEYLAEILSAKNICAMQTQKHIHLENDLKTAAKTKGFQEENLSIFSYQTHILPLLERRTF